MNCVFIEHVHVACLRWSARKASTQSTYDGIASQSRNTGGLGWDSKFQGGSETQALIKYDHCQLILGAHPQVFCRSTVKGINGILYLQRIACIKRIRRKITTGGGRSG